MVKRFPMNLIKNFRQLGTSKIRRDALEIVSAGIEAVLPKVSMSRELIVSGNILKIQNKKWDLSRYKRIFVVGAGKAVAEMAEGLEEILGKRISSGLVIDTRKKKLSRIEVVEGTHPLTSSINIRATEKIISLLENTGKEDLIFCLISGGGSALMESSRIPLGKLIEVNKLLLKSGATIQEINTIRKHISKVKGGQLVQNTKATIISLIMSDVITNKLDSIASGPTVPDTTTIYDAQRIQRKYNLPELPFIETPKKHFPNVTNVLLITNVPAAEAMRQKAKELGYNSKILTTQLSGEAREIGKKLAILSKKGTAIIATGETTVTIRGKGKGGRNQEVVLSASMFIKNGVVVSCSSDGVDFITEAAGGIVDENTNEQGKKLGLDQGKFLDNNDSYNFLKKVNGVIVTGKTHTNVGDLFLVLG